MNQLNWWDAFILLFFPFDCIVIVDGPKTQALIPNQWRAFWNNNLSKQALSSNDIDSEINLPGLCSLTEMDNRYRGKYDFPP
jgi:hypothetical protein